MSLKNLCISHLITNILLHESKILPMELNELIMDIQNIIKTVHDVSIRCPSYDISFNIHKDKMNNDDILSRIQREIDIHKNTSEMYYNKKILIKCFYDYNYSDKVTNPYLRYTNEWPFYETYFQGNNRSVHPYVELHLMHYKGNLEYISMKVTHTNDIKYLLDDKLLESSEIYQLNGQMSRLYTLDPILGAEDIPLFSLVEYVFIDGNNKYTLEISTYYPIATTVGFGKFVTIPLVKHFGSVARKTFSIYPEIIKIIDNIPIQYIHYISSYEVILKKTIDRIFYPEGLSIYDIIKIIAIYRPTIIKLSPFWFMYKSCMDENDVIKNYVESIIVLFEIDTFLNLEWIINNKNIPKHPIKVKYLYVQIDDTRNEITCLDNIINKILMYINSDTMIIGHKKSFPYSNTKFTITFQKFNNLIIIDQ